MSSCRAHGLFDCLIATGIEFGRPGFIVPTGAIEPRGRMRNELPVVLRPFGPMTLRLHGREDAIDGLGGKPALLPGFQRGVFVFFLRRLIRSTETETETESASRYGLRY